MSSLDWVCEGALSGQHICCSFCVRSAGWQTFFVVPAMPKHALAPTREKPAATPSVVGAAS